MPLHDVTAASRGDNGDAARREIARHLCESIIFTLGPAVLNRYILALNITDLSKAAFEGRGAPPRQPAMRD
ncbi:MAG TPA: hypothetical protein VGU20_10955 [Stellaceae bacterium]|nr:hypothetical protein [Stellaceae bacterium]